MVKAISTSVTPGQNQNTLVVTQLITSIDVGSTSSTKLHEDKWGGARAIRLFVRNDSDSSIQIGYYHTCKPTPESTADATDWYLEPDGSTTYRVAAGRNHRQYLAGPYENWKILTSNGSIGSASVGSVQIYATYLY